LSIIDLSQAARQPMSNEDNSLWAVCNGEIYNHKSLRGSLAEKGHQFQSRSDTEVILHLYEEHGPKCVDYLRGMFAFALWDPRKQTMFLARDRLGQKPLYYYADVGVVAFASEIGAILQLPRLDLAVDEKAIDCYFKYGYILGERTPYQRIRKLLPAFRMSIKNSTTVKERYWDVPFPMTHVSQAKHTDLIEEFDTILSEAVRLRLESDVPLGAFLSGGIDSSAVVSKMVSQSTQKVKTFAIGFSETSYDERSFAGKVAGVLQTDHRDYKVDFALAELLPKMVLHFGEPFADSSAIPTYHLVLEKVFSSLNVGSEYYGKSLIKQIKLLIEQANRLEESPLAVLPQVFDSSVRTELLGWQAAEKGYEGSSDEILQYARSGDHLDAISQMIWTDLHTYLPDDILVKVDRMSMAHALEVRSPFMDHKLVEFVARLPLEMKLKGFTTKYLLKRAMQDKLPCEIIQRKKHGFMVPLAAWFRNELALVGPGSAI
jgi:asparagine synthase (glutamine-hydrolysing)